MTDVYGQHCKSSYTPIKIQVLNSTMNSTYILLHPNLIDLLLNFDFPVTLHGVEALMGCLGKVGPTYFVQFTQDDFKRGSSVRVDFPAACGNKSTRYWSCRHHHNYAETQQITDGLKMGMFP